MRVYELARELKLESSDVLTLAKKLKIKVKAASSNVDSDAAAKIRVRCAGLVDRVSLIAPFSPDSELWADVVGGMKAGL